MMNRKEKPTTQSLNVFRNGYAVRARKYVIALVGFLLGSLCLSHSADAQSAGIMWTAKLSLKRAK